jgi:RNA polymerase sigma-70 factor (ECF subfamily)
MIFDDEFDELTTLAYQTAFRILGSRVEAEEVAQDTMVKAYVRWRKVQRHARPWVCRVAVNGALGIVRRRGRRHHVEPQVGFQTDVADRIHLQRLLANLSRRQRDVVALRYLADMSEAEVADELGISAGTVKTHAHRGIEALRQHLDRDERNEHDRSDTVFHEPKEPTDV